MADVFAAIEQYRAALTKKQESITGLQEHNSSLQDALAYWKRQASVATLHAAEAAVKDAEGKREAAASALTRERRGESDALLSALTGMAEVDAARVKAAAELLRPVWLAVHAEEEAFCAELQASVEEETGYARARADLAAQLAAARTASAQAAAQCEQHMAAAQAARDATRHNAQHAAAMRQESAAKAATLAAVSEKLGVMEGENGVLRARVVEAEARAATAQSTAARREAEAAAIHAQCDAAELRKHQEAANLAANRRVVELHDAEAAVHSYAATGFPLHQGHPAHPHIQAGSRAGVGMPLPPPGVGASRVPHQAGQGQGAGLPLRGQEGRPLQPVAPLPPPTHGYYTGRDGHGRDRR